MQTAPEAPLQSFQPPASPVSPAQPAAPSPFARPVGSQLSQAQDQPYVPAPFAKPGTTPAPRAEEKPYVPSPFAKHAPAPAQPQQPTPQVPPPLDSVPLVQVPNMQPQQQDLDDLIFKNERPPVERPPAERPPTEMYGEQSASAKHRAMRRADFTRPRIPSLDPPNKDIIDPPKQKRSFGDRMRDFLHAFKRLFKDD